MMEVKIRGRYRDQAGTACRAPLATGQSGRQAESGAFAGLDFDAAIASVGTREPMVRRLFAGGSRIRKFSSAMPRHRHQRGRPHSTAEADDCSDDTATPTVDPPQLGRSLETAAYLARNRKFESIPLQRRDAM